MRRRATADSTVATAAATFAAAVVVAIMSAPTCVQRHRVPLQCVVVPYPHLGLRDQIRAYRTSQRCSPPPSETRVTEREAQTGTSKSTVVTSSLRSTARRQSMGSTVVMCSPVSCYNSESDAWSRCDQETHHTLLPADSHRGGII